tara:strand:+ start:647 stop:1786 length:1140 start_codon:yes stop_codon:yes gene_type:complete
MTWKTKTLGELCKMYQPTTLSKKNLNTNGKYYVYGANGIIGMHSEFNHEKSELILGCRGTCGSMKITKPYSWINGNAMVIQPNENEILKTYIEYYFKGIINFSKIITGTAQPQITRQSLNPILIVYPSLSKQQEIIAKLNKYIKETDKIILMTETILKKLSQSKKVYYKKFLSSNSSNNTTEVSEVVDMFPGFAFKSSDYTDSANGISLLRGDNISPNFINLENCKYFPKKLAIKYEKYYLQADDIVLGMDRPYISSGLRVAKIHKTNLPCLLVQRIMCLRVKPRILSDYLYLIMQSPSFINHLAKNQTGLSVPHISPKAIESFKFVLPDIKLQSSFINEYQKINNQVNSYNKIQQDKVLSLKNLKLSFIKQEIQNNLI